jgi:hypothetical protein
MTQMDQDTGAEVVCVQPCSIAIEGHAMPEQWDHKLLASLIEMMIALFAAADLDDDEADAVMAILLPKLWERSGLDLLLFCAMVAAMLPGDLPRNRDRVIPDRAPHSSRH